MHKKTGQVLPFCFVSLNFAILSELFTKLQPMTTEANFIEDVIDEALPMQVLEPAVFDACLAQGWRVLGTRILRHSFASHHGMMCKTIPLRIRLSDFRLSKGQRTLLRRHAASLEVHFGPIQITSHKIELFLRHSEKFNYLKPQRFLNYIGERAHIEPVAGMEFTVFDDHSEPIACSFIHLGKVSVSGTYCIFEPTYSQLSLGIYTMLLEIAKAQELGKQFYYHGYVYDMPSSYDYKLQFHGLEAMDWKTGAWQAIGRKTGA